MDLPEDVKIKEGAGAKFHKLFKLSMANDGSLQNTKTNGAIYIQTSNLSF